MTSLTFIPLDDWMRNLKHFRETAVNALTKKQFLADEIFKAE